MKTIRTLSRVLVGIVFVFSGFVKAVDPAGSAIKFREYFEAFHLEFLVFLALPLAILLSASELMVGLNLLGAVRMKFTAWVLLLFMSFFTVLTSISALTNPVSDCGCFGDALKLSNWQTFGKNIILFIPTAVIFLQRRKYQPVFVPSLEFFLVSFNFIVACIVLVYCMLHEPLLDFRPYKIGTSIPEKMTNPAGARDAIYETILVYRKDGIKKEFTDKNFPWQDTTWKWVETRQKLIRKGDEPPIHDFSITRTDGTDITDKVVTDTGYIMLFITPDLKNAGSEKSMQQLNELALRCQDLGFGAYCVTSSTDSQIQTFKSIFQPAFEICTADETTLKTMIRANPGVMLLHRGTILGKWNYRDAPNPADLKPDMISYVLGSKQHSYEIYSLYALAMAVIFVYVSALLNKKTN